ncbi:MAG: tetratricopeptide repeat protein [Cyanobacteria bacterium J06581_3]
MADVGPAVDDLPAGSLSAENQDALDNLLVAIEANGRRLGIFIAVCDDPQLKEDIISRYEQTLAPAFQHYRLTLDADEPSLKALLIQQVKQNAQLQQDGQAVMTILGAERLRTLKFDAAQSQQEAFFGYLQWTREGLQDFPFAIVLWVTYQLQEQLSRKAPDFWSWRQDVVRFVSPKRMAIETDVFSSLKEHEQFSHFENVGNTLLIDDLEALIAETASKSPGSTLLASLHLQAGKAYVNRVERGEAQDYKAELKKAIVFLRSAARLLKDSEAAKDYAGCLDRLARVYELQGRYGEAEPLYLDALEISKAELGDRHPSTANSLLNLATLYHDTQQHQQALKLIQQALDIYVPVLGIDHPSTQNTIGWRETIQQALQPTHFTEGN